MIGSALVSMWYTLLLIILKFAFSLYLFVFFCVYMFVEFSWPDILMCDRLVVCIDIPCDSVITRSFFSPILTKYIFSVFYIYTQIYDTYFVGSDCGLYIAILCISLCSDVCSIGPRYNGTWLYVAIVMCCMRMYYYLILDVLRDSASSRCPFWLTSSAWESLHGIAEFLRNFEEISLNLSPALCL